MEIPDLVMSACLEHYKNLPKQGKPKENEWTIMSSVVGAFQKGDQTDMKVLSLGTGSKCIGRSFMSPEGDILNDSHSEVLARRGFLRYLYMELMNLNKTNESDVFYRIRNESFNVGVKDCVKFYFATTASPCGDASIIPKTCDGEPETNLTLKNDNEESLGRVVTSKKDIEEPPAKRIKNDTSSVADIHRTGAKCLASSDIQDLHLPGVDYHQTGAVRTKPGRGDPTASVSCSDKIARWNATGIQGALLSLLIEKPIYLEMIVIGGGCPYSHSSCDRAINQRINSFKTVGIVQSRLTFDDMKTSKKVNPSPKAMLWIKNGNGVEVTVNGRKQGTTKKNIRKKSSRSCVCKRELLTLFKEVVNSSSNRSEIMKTLNSTSLESMSYLDVKSKAINYLETWNYVKKNYFKVWTEKPKDLLNFRANDT